jgi:hypothetical protein
LKKYFPLSRGQSAAERIRLVLTAAAIPGNSLS